MSFAGDIDDGERDGLKARIASLERENARLRAGNYQELVQISPIPGLINFRDRIVFVNEAALKLLGAQSPEQVLDHSPLDFIDRSEQENVQQRIRALLETGRPTEPVQETFVRLDGSTITVVVTAWPIPYGDGHAIHTALWDITAQKQIEERLQASLDLIDSIIVGMPDPIFVKDLDLRYVLLNPACARVLGVPREEAIDRRDAEMLDPKWLPAIEAVDRRVMATGVTEVLEETLMDQGKVRVFLSTKSAWRDHAGKIIGVIGVAHDITDRKRAERELEESRDRLHLALEAGRMGTWDYDMVRDRLVWSEGHYRLFGLKPGEVTPSSELFTSRVHPDDRARVENVVARAVSSRQDFTVQYRVVWGDGSVHWLEARGKVGAENGRAVRTLGVVTDITSRKQTEDRLREAAKLESLGVLAGGVAHDFNNLLVGILGNASLLTELLPPPDRHMAEQIVSAAQRAAALTHQMLAYSGKGRFVVELVDISKAVRELTDLLRASIHRTVDLDLALADELPAIEADVTQFEQVVMNLVINGAEACGERPGRVSVSTRLAHLAKPEIERAGLDIAPGDYLLLEVRDTGCGMDESTKARIFDPFFTTKFTGRGLGLAATLGIVRGHGGGIRIESELGKGSSFQVFFPAASSTAVTVLPQRAVSLSGSGTVLIVDDEPLVQQTARAALEHWGYRVLTANNGREGVEQLSCARDEIALVVLDLTMPVMTGEQTYQEIQRISPNLPVILSSGYNESEITRKFRFEGLAGFLQKPYTVKALAEKVKTVLSAHLHA